MMTEQLRLTNSDEDVANYLRWIIESDTAKEYWQSRQAAVSGSLPLAEPPDYNLPLDFFGWYSGMNRTKILAAYARWKKESGNDR